MLTLARVVEVRREAHAVDIEFMEDGRRVAGVKVLTGVGGSDFGFNDMARPAQTGYGKGNSRTRDVYAVVSFMNDHPIVLGFLYPEVAQVLFPDKERMVYRHASDVYLTIDGQGNTELFHPSGAYLRLGQAPDHEDLTGKDYDKVWKIAKNTGKPVHIHVEQAGGTASLDIAPGGAVTLKSKATVDVDAEGAVTAKSAASITLDAPTITLTGAVTINGQTTANGGIAATGDVTAGGISGMHHTHTEQGDGKDVSPPK